MKNIFLSLLLFLCLFHTGFSQANVTSSGISIKGILRDESNNVLVNVSANLKVDLYYLGANNTEVSYISRTGSITSDGFGVFSYILDINKTEYIKIANSVSYVKISNGNTLLVKEKLKSVPYAIHAQNGVPTGSILAISTSSVPPGYIPADGRAIPNDDYHAALRAIFGANVPDLRGMFLRGAGTQTVSSVSYSGPTIRNFQADGLKTHTHGFSYTGTTSSEGSHRHGIKYNKGGSSSLSPAILDYNIEASSGGSSNSDDTWIADWFSDAGGHTHTYNFTATVGNYPTTNGSATKPVANGVFYIIKI
jgi:hypothetical protein